MFWDFAKSIHKSIDDHFIKSLSGDLKSGNGYIRQDKHPSPKHAHGALDGIEVLIKER